jgi:protein arginine kinase activator
MKCQSCSAQATVHLTDIVQGEKRELHFCQTCAEKQQLIKKQELNLPAIMQTLISTHIGPLTDELARLTCPACGIKYMEFRSEGRLGCPYDYHVFHVGLEPLIKRIHRSLRHSGKRPKCSAADPARQCEILDLYRKLRVAVDGEEYELAAQLRDFIKKKEATDESG